MSPGRIVGIGRYYETPKYYPQGADRPGIVLVLNRRVTGPWIEAVEDLATRHGLPVCIHRVPVRKHRHIFRGRLDERVMYYTPSGGFRYEAPVYCPTRLEHVG